MRKRSRMIGQYERVIDRETRSDYRRLDRGKFCPGNVPYHGCGQEYGRLVIGRSWAGVFGVSGRDASRPHMRENPVLGQLR